MIRPRFSNISLQVGAEVYSFEAFRGPGNQTFVPDEGEEENYLLDYLSDEEDEDIEEENDEE